MLYKYVVVHNSSHWVGKTWPLSGQQTFTLHRANVLQMYAQMIVADMARALKHLAPHGSANVIHFGREITAAQRWRSAMMGEITMEVWQIYSGYPAVLSESDDVCFCAL